MKESYMKKNITWLFLIICNIQINAQKAMVPGNLIFSKRKITILVLAMDGMVNGLTKKCLQPLTTKVSGHVIKNGGHWLAEERPNDILEQMIPFFHSKWLSL